MTTLGTGAYLILEYFDRLVRLNIGLVPIEASFSDWTTLLGYALYILIRTDGRVEYLYLPLNHRLLQSVRELSEKGTFSSYRYANGRLTPFGRHLALFFLARGVPVAAIARELDVSAQLLERLRRGGPRFTP